MSVKKEPEGLQEPTWKELKNIFLAKKQGEALERASTALTFDEAISLGQFGHQAVYALSMIEMHQAYIFSLTDYNGDILNRFVETIGRASGSIQGNRMLQTFEAVGALGQYKPMEGFTGDMSEEADEET